MLFCYALLGSPLSAARLVYVTSANQKPKMIWKDNSSSVFHTVADISGHSGFRENLNFTNAKKIPKIHELFTNFKLPLILKIKFAVMSYK